MARALGASPARVQVLQGGRVGLRAGARAVESVADASAAGRDQGLDIVEHAFDAAEVSAAPGQGPARAGEIRLHVDDDQSAACWIDHFGDLTRTRTRHRGAVARVRLADAGWDEPSPMLAPRAGLSQFGAAGSPEAT
jgi:hypothetical protein